MRPETYDDVWLVGGVRSALGRFGGALREVPVVDLARQVIGAALDRLDWSQDALDPGSPTCETRGLSTRCTSGSG